MLLAPAVGLGEKLEKVEEKGWAKTVWGRPQTNRGRQGRQRES